MSDRSISSIPMSQMAGSSETTSSSEKSEFIVYGYINYVYVHDDGTVSMSVDARTIKVTKTLLDSFHDRTQSEADEHALFQSMADGKVPDGTIIEEGITYDIRLNDQDKCRRSWRANTRKVFTPRASK